MKHTAAPPSQPQKASGRSPAASQLRGGRLTKLDGEVASCAPSPGRMSSALLSSAALAGILSGAFLAMTAQEAQAACTESAGAWTCTGVVAAAQSIKRSASAISVNLDSGFDMDVAQGVGFTLEQSGAGGIAFVQAAGGQEIVGHSGAVHATNSGAGGISITATGEIRKTGRGAVLKAVNSDASGGSVSVSVGSVTGSGADGHAIQVTNSGAGTTAVTASGSVSSGAGEGDGVNVETGKGSSSVTVSVATVTGSRTGVRVSHRGAGSVSVSATGTVKASGGYGGSHALYVANRGSAASVNVTVATVTAKGTGAVDGIHVLQMHGGAVTVIASGSVSSAGRHGIFVDQRGQSGTPGQSVRRNVDISVSGMVTGGGGYRDAAIKVNANEGNRVRVVLGSGAVVGRAGEAGIVESSGNAWVEVKRDAEVNGGIRLGSGRDTLIAGGRAKISGGVDLASGNDRLTLNWDAKVSGGVNSGDGDDTLTVTNRAEVSGGVRLLDGNDILTVSGGAKISGAVGLGDGNDRLFVSRGAKIFGDVNFWHGNDRLTVSEVSRILGDVDFGSGNDTLTVSGGAEVSGTVDLGDGNNTLTISEISRILGDVDFGSGNDRLTVSGGTEVSGTVDLGDGNNTLTISEISRIVGDVDFGSGSDTLTVGGGSKVSGTVDFGNGNDNLNFGPGFSEIGEIRGVERFEFENGAIARITDTSGTDMSGLASLEIKSGAMAILDNAGHKHKVGSIRLKPGGTLNIADGVAGKSGNNSPHFNNVALLLGPDQELNGTLIIDANFAQSWADVLGWDGTGTRNWRGTVLIEPAVLEGRKGNSAIVTSSLSASQIRVPQGFSVVFDTDWQQFAIRQDMESGACTGAGSGAFTCRNLIHETQSLNASGETLKVALGSSSVVHALAGTRQGLTLRQSGAGGVTLTQSATGGRIAAAGHAIHALNSGAGSVSIKVTGLVVGGFTGRVADAGGIVVEGGGGGGGVRISAASVTGLRHGIFASAIGGVSLEASGSVTGMLGDGVEVRTRAAKGPSAAGSVAISVATVSGGRTGVRVIHGAAGSISIRATGAVRASGGAGDDHVVDVTVHGHDSNITVAVATVTAHGTGAADGIHVRQPHRGSVNVTVSGSVSSAGRHGIFVDQRSQRSNMHGDVRIGVSDSVTGSAGAAIRVDSDWRGDGVRISLESGAVVGRAGEDAIILSYGNAVVDVKAGAAVKGDVDLGNGNDTLTVSSATVSGDVNLGWGNDTLTLSSATISGEVSDGDGYNILTISDGSEILGGMKLGGGSDMLTVSSATVSGGVNLGSGKDTLAVRDGAKISGGVYLGWGEDTMAVSGGAVSGGINFGSRDDKMAVSGGTVSGGINFGWGEDKMAVSGGTVSGGINFGWGEDKMAVSGGTVSGGINFGWGEDKMAVSGGTVSGGINFGRGEDKMAVSGGTVSGGINFGWGEDKMAVSGGTVSGGINFGWGEDKMAVSGGTVSGYVNLGWHDDTMTVTSGTVSGGVDLGPGNDTLTVSGGILLGGVDLDSGNDTLSVSGVKRLGGVHRGSSNNTLTFIDVGTFSGGVKFIGGENTVTFSDVGTLSGEMDFFHSDVTLTFSDVGTLSGEMDFSHRDNTVTFSDVGTLSGEIDFSHGDNTVTFSDVGTLSGEIDFWHGDNTLAFSSVTTVSSDMDFSHGDNTVTFSDVGTLSGEMDFFISDGTLTFSDVGTLSGDMDFSGGDNTLAFSSVTTVSSDMDFSHGENTVTFNDVGTFSGEMDFSHGDNTLTFIDVGTLSVEMDFSHGENTVTFIDVGTFSGEMDLSSGDNTVTFSDVGKLSGEMDFSSGDNTVTFSDVGTLSVEMDFSHGDNTLAFIDVGTLSVEMGFRHGDSALTFSGGTTVSSDMNFSYGDNALTVSDGAKVLGNVNLHSGGDAMTVSSATVIGDLDFSGGNDILNVTNGAEVSGGVDLGSGNDTLTVSSATVSGGVDLGSGNDTLTFSNATVSGNVDPGKGDDKLTLSRSTVSGDLEIWVGNDTLTVSDRTKISGGVEMFDGNDFLNIINGASVLGGVDLGTGDDTLTLSSATVSGGVDPGEGDDTLTFRGATVSGGVDLSVGSDTLTVSDGTKISGEVRMFNGNDTLNVIDGAKVSGDVDLGEGDDMLTIRDGATVASEVELGEGHDRMIVSGAVTVFGDFEFDAGHDRLTVRDGAAVYGDVYLGFGNDTLIVSSATVSGDVHFGWGLSSDTLIVKDGATVSGDVTFTRHEDVLTVSNATVSGNVDFGSDNDRLNFGPGFSEVIGKVRNAERFMFESGAVARIARTKTTDHASLEIKGGAVAILDDAGLNHNLGSLRLGRGGTLNIADGVAGSRGENSTFSSNIALRLGPDQQLSGTLIIDANFHQSWADGLAWNGRGSRNWRGTMHIEPAVLRGKKGNSAAITGDLSVSQLTAPEGFSIFHNIQTGKTNIRQDMEDGDCTSVVGGAFVCRDLIHETQSLSVTDKALKVTLDRTSVVHALAETRRGLSLSQSGAGGLSLTQSSTGSRIAAAGHAIHARNSGAGDVSITVTGPVAGGMTGRVAAADGIAAENGADGGDMRISAASVAGLRHGIAASADGGDVFVMASGPVIGWLGEGVRAVAPKGNATVSVASVAGARAGIFGSGTGSVSISASGAVTSSGIAGIDGLVSGAGSLSISATEVVGGSFGIRAMSKGSGSVSVTASGAVKTADGAGAAIQGFAAGGALSISAAGVSGGIFGIKAVGGGSVSVSASGSVTSMEGASRHGVHARASGTGTLTVSVDGDVRGGETGITAVGGEGGNVAVTASGGITFGGGHVDGAAGIHAEVHNGDLTISASGGSRDGIVGKGDGIRAVSSGTGAVSISAAVAVKAGSGDAISVKRGQVGSVGISVSSLATASLLSGRAGAAAAVRTDAPSGSSVTISLNSGAHLRMPGADAVIGAAGDTTLTVESGAAVQGRIALGSGTDTLVFEGGAFSGVERMDGGAGRDTLRFVGGSGALHATIRSEGLRGWERVVVESGAALSGGVRLAADSGSLEFRGSVPSGLLDGGNGRANTLSLLNVGTASVPASNLRRWETISVGTGSDVAFGTGAHKLTVGTLRVETGGTLNVGRDADTGDVLTVSGDFRGSGTVVLNANFMPNGGASDRLTITGSARGATSVVFVEVGESGTVDGAARPQRIDGVIGFGGSLDAGAFHLGKPIRFGSVGYSLKLDADNREFYLLRTDGAGGDAGLSPHGAVAAVAALHSVAAADALNLEAEAVGAAGGAAGGACVQAQSHGGAFACGGISSPQRLGATGNAALLVRLDPQAAVETDGNAFSLTHSGAGGIVFEQKEFGPAIQASGFAAAAIRAGSDAVAARNAGGGLVSISAHGKISAGGDGVSAVSDARGEGVRISVATVAAGGDGISVVAGAGDVSVAAGEVTARVAGIRVHAGDGVTGVEILAGSVAGGADGISVEHRGAGEVRISATGAVSGTRGDGIRVRSYAAPVSVSVSGEVAGGAIAGSAAIRTVDASATVTLEDGASVLATGSGAAIKDGAGASLVMVREGASVFGGISLGAGADELILAGGDFGGITEMDGGAGRDALRIEAGRGHFPALADGALSGFESVVVSGDAVIEGDMRLPESAEELVFADGARIEGRGKLVGGGNARLSLRGVAGELDAARLSGWAALEIGEGSRVSLLGQTLGQDAAKKLSVTGTMAFGTNAKAGDTFTVEGDFSGGGRVEIDADLAAGSADRLVIEGDVSGTTEIALRDVTPQGVDPSGAGMTVIAVGGRADASAFRLAGGAVLRGAFVYDLRMTPDGFSLGPDGEVSDTGAALQSADASIAAGFARATTMEARAAARAAASGWARVGSAATFAERGDALIGQEAVDFYDREALPVWIRFHGDSWKYGADGGAKIDVRGFEVGMDLLSRDAAAGKWLAGLTAQYGTVGAETEAGGLTGRQDGAGYGFGATISWLAHSGFYADAQGEFRDVGIQPFLRLRRLHRERLLGGDGPGRTGDGLAHRRNGGCDDRAAGADQHEQCQRRGVRIGLPRGQRQDCNLGGRPIGPRCGDRACGGLAARQRQLPSHPVGVRRNGDQRKDGVARASRRVGGTRGRGFARPQRRQCALPGRDVEDRPWRRWRRRRWRVGLRRPESELVETGPSGLEVGRQRRMRMKPGGIRRRHPGLAAFRSRNAGNCLLLASEASSRTSALPR